MTVDRATFYGGSQLINVDLFPFTATISTPRILFLVGIGPVDTLNLPDARLLKLGGPQYFLINTTVFGVIIRDDGSNGLFTMASNSNALLVLADNSTANGIWLERVSF